MKKKQQPKKIPIIDYLVQHGLSSTRNGAFAIVMSGNVYVNQVKVSSIQRSISSEDNVIIKENRRFVSRGGEKLESALNHFSLHIHNSICLDVGASTGGFTDYLLKHGAVMVYAVDVGYGKLDWTLRNDPRVINLERCNIRDVHDKIPKAGIDMAVCDVSFTSLKGILPKIEPYIKQGGNIISLVKPQFEVSPASLKKGIVRNKDDQLLAVEEVKTSGIFSGLNFKDFCPSKIKGTKGNQEYFIWWVKQ